MNDQSSFDAATRVAAGDDGTNYDGVAITLHWLTAFLVIANFALAQTWDWFAKPTKGFMRARKPSPPRSASPSAVEWDPLQPRPASGRSVKRRSRR